MHAADTGLAGTQQGPLDQMQHRHNLHGLLDYQAYNAFDTSIYNFEV
jgi:methylisocitrate lyase